MTYSDLLSERILELMDRDNWKSIRAFSEYAQLPYSTVNKIVIKERENPSILTVHSIAVAFHMDIVEFLDFDSVRSLTSEELKSMRQNANSQKEDNNEPYVK